MATYYVDAATGSDSDDGSTELLAFATLGKAEDTARTAGDQVYVKGGTAYAETLALEVSGYAGTLAAPITYEGYTTTPGDGGTFTITGSGSRTNCVGVDGGSALYMVFKNVVFTGATGTAVAMSNNDNITFVNCTFESNGGRAVHADNSISFWRCRFIDNCNAPTSAAAVQVDSECAVLFCYFYNNVGTHAISIDNGIVFGCRFRTANTATDSKAIFQETVSSARLICMYNSFYGEDSGQHEDGVYIGASTTAPPIIVGNYFRRLDDAVESVQDFGAWMSLTDFNIYDDCFDDTEKVVSGPNDVTYGSSHASLYYNETDEAPTPKANSAIVTGSFQNIPIGGFGLFPTGGPREA